MRWAWWDWPVTSLTSRRPLVLWHCWLGHLTRKIISEMTYNVLSGMLNSTMPYHDVASRWVNNRHSIDVDVSALLTPRHYKCRRLVELPSATAPFRWLQRMHGTVCHNRLGPAPHFWHSGGRLSLTFFISHMADVAPSTPMVSRRLHWAVQQY